MSALETGGERGDAASPGTEGVAAAPAWPAGPLLAFYGDDFTGSTDAMEVLAAAGLPTVLFLGVPGAALQSRFAGARCVGIAGSSRGRSPAWMEAELPRAFETLRAVGAPVLQYKVCSTFDSSPDIGSIGRAIDLGVAACGGRWSPTLVGAPRLNRFQAFGNLFASVGGVAWRLDRHPTMSRHPVTPMNESDLRRHLARQTSRRIELIDLVQVRKADAPAAIQALSGDDTPVVFIDVLDEDTLLAAGRLVWEGRGAGLFSASSSGLEYALVAYWRSMGWIGQAAGLPAASAVPLVGVVSGSCSPGTAAQIAWARDNGFHAERLQVARALSPAMRDAEIERVTAAAREAVDRGASPLVFSAEGPDDPSVAGFDAIAAEAGLTRPEAARKVGEALAEVTRRLLDTTGLRRWVIAGGDSSGEICSALDIGALTVEAAFVPAAPLCRAWSDDPRRDGLQLVLKGGQIGGADLFGLARNP